MIQNIINFFSTKNNCEKTKKLKEIDIEISNCKTYKKLVILTNLYNKIKNEKILN